MKNTKSKLLIAVLTGLISVPALAVDPVPVSPTSTAAPASASPVPKPTPRVEVFPFSPINNATQNDWTGRGIQENLQSDVSRTGATLILAQHAPAPNDDLTGLAKQNHADLAVSGSFQVVGNQIRVNGHVVDVATNATVGGFSATGNQQDLFRVEDALGEQLRALLPRQASPQQVSEAYQTPAPAPIVYSESAPVYTAAQPAANYYYSEPAPTGYYSPDYYYSDYGAGYYPGDFGFYGGIGYVYGGGYGRGYRGDYHGYGYGNRGSFYRGGVGGGIGGGFHASAVGGSRGGFGGGGHGGGGHR